MKRLNIFVILGWSDKGSMSHHFLLVGYPTLSCQAQVWICECHNIFIWNDVVFKLWVTSDWWVCLSSVIHGWIVIILWELLEPSHSLSFSVSTRRVGLADIEKIAPLEEGALPYNLAEVQRQVENMKTCWCVWFPLPHWQLLSLLIHSLRLNVTAKIKKIYNFRLMIAPACK